MNAKRTPSVGNLVIMPGHHFPGRVQTVAHVGTWVLWADASVSIEDASDLAIAFAGYVPQDAYNAASATKGSVLDPASLPAFIAKATDHRAALDAPPRLDSLGRPRLSNEAPRAMSIPNTYLSLSYETGWKLIHDGQPITASNRTIEQCYDAAYSMGLNVDTEYWDGDLQQFVDPMHSNKDEAVELADYQLRLIDDDNDIH